VSNVVLIDHTQLPRTHAEIVAQFPDPGLRKAVWEAARRGAVVGLAGRVALTASGRAGLAAVQSVLDTEWVERGFGRVYVGEADPTAYGPGQVAAYLDQPL
jgi:hypothetical protein